MNTINNNKMDPLTKKVFERINNEHVTPRPRWEFLAKNYTLWGLGALAVVLGALAFAATLFEIQNIDWNLYFATHDTFLAFFFSTAPFVLVAAIAIFIAVSYVNVRHTIHGYRYPFVVISLIVVLSSLTFGTGLYAMGYGGVIDESLGDHPPFFRPVLKAQQALWVAPEKGVLEGTIVSSDPALSSFTIKDFKGQDWKVNTSDLTKREANIVARGGDIRLIGVPSTSTSSEFHPCFVLPSKLRGQGGPLQNAVSNGRRPHADERSAECKNIRPFQQLHDIEQAAETASEQESETVGN